MIVVPVAWPRAAEDVTTYPTNPRVCTPHDSSLTLGGYSTESHVAASTANYAWEQLWPIHMKTQGEDRK